MQTEEKSLCAINLSLGRCQRVHRAFGNHTPDDTNYSAYLKIEYPSNSQP